MCLLIRHTLSSQESSMRVLLAILVVLVVFLGVTTASDEKDVAMCSGATCLIQYTQGFTSVENIIDRRSDDDDSSIQTDIELHCSLDMQLAKCTSEALEKCGRNEILVAIGRALLSYMVYDYRLGVCPNHKENEFLELLGPFVTDNGSLFEMKLKYLYNAPYADCAAKMDYACLEKFVHMMKLNPNLCLSIPFKYNCLRNEKCHPSITKALLDIFPQEANNVLSVLCK